MKKFLIILLTFIITPVFAQQKDRKDFLIEALTAQRERAASLAWADAGSCYADASMEIVKLRAEIAELKANIEKKQEISPVEHN